MFCPAPRPKSHILPPALGMVPPEACCGFPHVTTWIAALAILDVLTTPNWQRSLLGLIRGESMLGQGRAALPSFLSFECKQLPFGPLPSHQTLHSCVGLQVPDI
uniref:Uncharacterized protein n=1 Tax=Eutreptiella gymnastica TaxID=73025 RepID=A0A7S1IYI5_9EUGL